MNTKIKQVNLITLSNLNSLDPIMVVINDIEPGKGSIIISCFGRSWTAFWPGMGIRTVSQFFCDADEYYLSGCLSDISNSVIDYDLISNKTNENIEEQTIMMFTERLIDLYGNDWFYNLPTKPNPDHTYLCRIIKTVQQYLGEKE